MAISRSRKSLFNSAELSSFRHHVTSPSTFSNSTILTRARVSDSKHTSLFRTPNYLKSVFFGWFLNMATLWAVAKHEAKLCWGFMRRDVSMGMLPVPAFSTASLLYRHATPLEMLNIIPSKSHSERTPLP